MALPTATGTAGHTGKEGSTLAKSLDEEYHNPFDDFSTRDLLLSLVPFIVTFAFKDAALPAAIAFGIAWAGALLVMRFALFDAWHKLIWPMLDIITVIALAILRGFVKRWPYQITKWWNVILPLIYIATAALSLVWRRSFTAHHGRYPKFDRGGRGVWHGDASFRRTGDLTTLGWITAWSVSLLLSLIPILTGHWFTWHALNVIFNYVIPFVLLISALVFQQLMGKWYQSTASKATATSLTPGERGAAYPSGVAEPGTTATETGGVPGGTTYTSSV